VYLNHLEFFLAGVLEHNLTVPLVTLYDIQGKEIKSMQNSREYFVSEAYKRMSEFVEEELNKEDLALTYAKNSIATCDLNPDAIFHYAYSIDNANEEIELLKRVVKLIQKSDALFDRDTYALYNNLGFSIWNAGKEEQYDTALKYLEIAYKDSDGEGVNSLGTMANIYIAQKKYEEAYEIIKDPVYAFLHNKDTDIIESADSAYWYFIRIAIDTAYALKDNNTTKYMCEKYFLLKDKEYEDCHTYIKAIEKVSDSTKPIYSFWKLYTEPEIYDAAKKDKKIEGTLECGTVMTYADSLKYKSTSRKQSKLLEKFTTLFAPHKVPHTLKELIKIEEELGADSYVISFYLDPDDRDDFFDGMFSYDNETLNKKVAKYFIPLSHIDGKGANAALWLKDGNKTDLENAPIVEFGSEGQIDIVAKNLKDFIYMLSFGIEPMDGGYSQFVSINEDYYRRENFMAYRKWLKDTMKIEPVKDLKVWGTPNKIEMMEEEAQTLYRDKLFQWLYTLIPNHGTVEEGKQEADKFSILAKEKKRLIALRDENATSEVYQLLARNEQGLRDIDRSLIENISAYYKQAFELDHNTSIIEEWAMFMGNFSHNKDKANLYIKFSEIYSALDNENKTKEYLSLGLELYKVSVVNEADAAKKMRLYESIAEIYKDTNQSTNAITYYKKALAVKVDDKLWLKKYYYVDLAEIYEEQKEYLLAIENYKMAVAIVEKEKDKALYNYHIADNFKALKDFGKALSYARKSLIQAPKDTALKENCLELIDDIKLLKYLN
jgi:tetratricopeptide (TPR) repeat protein